MRVSREISIYRAQRSQQGCSLSLGMLRLAEPPTGRARLRSSLKSPRNPITPIETSRVATLHPGLYKRLREGARRVIGASAKPLYAFGGKAGGLDRRVNPVRWREETFSTECGRGTPSTACGRSPSLEEGGLWGGDGGNGQVSLRGRAKGDRGARCAGTPSTACRRSPSLEEGGLGRRVRGTSKF